MATLAEALTLALQRHRAGDLGQATHIYRQILQVDPDQVDALYLLGVASMAQGALAEAESCLRLILRQRPDHADAHNTLGAVLAKQRKLDEAVGSYRTALRLRPDLAEAHHNLGTALLDQGKADEALVHFSEALRLDPEYANAHNGRGNALLEKEAYAEAIASFHQALRLRPDHANALNNLGIALTKQGKLEEAVAAFRKALHYLPANADMHTNLGNALAKQKRFDEAVACYQHALRLQAQNAEAHTKLADAFTQQDKLTEAADHYRQAVQLGANRAEHYNNLGGVLLKLGKVDEAVAHCQHALRLNANFIGALNNLAVAHMKQGKLEEALVGLRQALASEPDADKLSNLGGLLSKLGQAEEAEQNCREALRLKPNYFDALNNLSIALNNQGRLEEALAVQDQMLELQPDNADTHLARAMVHLLRGDMERGWPEFEWRMKTKTAQPRSFPQPLWDGSLLDGRTILLHAEQGLGDTLQFVRYAALVKERGGTVLLMCAPKLAALLSRCPGIDRIVPEDKPLPAFDVHAPLLSLPLVFRTTLATVPAKVPYLFADPALTEYWREQLGAVRAFKVGINWQGNPKYEDDRHRSLPLAHFEPLSRIPGVQLFSLQKGFGTEQLRVLDGRFPVTDLDKKLTEKAGAFTDTAAALVNLDLVVSSDTALVHLAGGLGVPIWMATPFAPDWRWLMEREDNPWYPTMRLFRQKKWGDWADVFRRIADELKALVAGRGLAGRSR